MVPSWITAVKAAPGSSQPQKAETIRRWAVLEIGRNSVSPWTMPRTMACKALMAAGQGSPHLGRSGERGALELAPAPLLEVELALEPPGGVLVEVAVGVQALDRLALGGRELALQVAGDRQLALVVA